MKKALMKVREGVCCAVWLGGSIACAQANPMALPAKQWAVEAANNELGVLQNRTPLLRYRIRVQDAKGDQIRDVLQSKDGPVARLIFKDNRPLTTEEDTAERQRLQDMLDSPAAFAKHVKNEGSGKKMAADIVSQLPDAMIYSYVAGQPQRTGAERVELVIDYEPNASWKPPTMVSEGLTGLRGRAWIDPKSHYMTRLEGHIFKPVNVGMGMFVHIYPGGELAFDQIQLPNGRWIFSHFVEHVTVRALMVKTVRENTEINGADYTEVAPMAYQDAIKLLLAAPLPQKMP